MTEAMEVVFGVKFDVHENLYKNMVLKKRAMYI